MGSAVVELQERLDLPSAGDLAAVILDHAGNDLDLNASAVTHCGAMGIQVIRAAAKSWAKSGNSLQISGLSTDCIDQIGLLGFTPDSLCLWEDGA